MALRPADQHRRDQLVEAAAVLTEHGRPDLGQAVEFVLSAQGAPFVQRLQDLPATSERPNIPMRLPKADRDEIKTRAKAAGDKLDVEVHEAFRAFLAGTFEPQPLERAPHGSGDTMANLNVRTLDPAVRLKVEVKCSQMRTGGQRMYVSTVALDWLYRKYEIGRYAPVTE